MAGAEAYPRAKFHFDPFKRLATIRQRYRQERQTGKTDRQTDRQTGQRFDGIGRTVLQTVAYNGSPYAIGPLTVLSVCAYATLVY